MTSIRAAFLGLMRSDVMRAAQRYFFVGAASSLLEWAIFAGFLYLAGFHYILSGTLSFLLATAANYIMSVRFVFGPGGRGRKERIFLIYLVSTVGIAFNLGVLAFGVDVLEIHVMAAKVLATGVVFGWNFVARYYFVFR